jgi:hypothetical protein
MHALRQIRAMGAVLVSLCEQPAMTTKTNVLVVGTCCGCAGFGVIGGLAMSETIGIVIWAALWAVQCGLMFLGAYLDRQETNRFMRRWTAHEQTQDLVRRWLAYEQKHVDELHEFRIH